MPAITVDFTGDESHWDGAVAVVLNDDVDGTVFGIGERQLVMTTTQAITLFDMLDEHLHGRALKGRGDVRDRIVRAIEFVATENMDLFRAAVGPKKDATPLAVQIMEAIRMCGLRFRITDEEDVLKPTPAEAR